MLRIHHADDGALTYLTGRRANRPVDHRSSEEEFDQGHVGHRDLVLCLLERFVLGLEAPIGEAAVLWPSRGRERRCATLRASPAALDPCGLARTESDGRRDRGGDGLRVDIAMGGAVSSLHDIHGSYP
jgi:hypothetical protein